MTEDLVAAWWELHRLQSGDRSARLASDGYSWAWEKVQVIVDEGGPEAVDLLMRLVDSATTESDLALVGAGPLEDLIVTHGRLMDQPEGTHLLVALIEAATSNPRFRMALGNVWYERSDLPLSVEDRVPGLPTPR